MRSNFRFLPSEEARLVLGYLQGLGLDKVAEKLLQDCDALSEFRSIRCNMGNSGPHLLGLTLSEIFDFYYQHHYDNSIQKEAVPSRIEMVYSKSTQTDHFCPPTREEAKEVIPNGDVPASMSNGKSIEKSDDGEILNGSGLVNGNSLHSELDVDVGEKGNEEPQENGELLVLCHINEETCIEPNPTEKEVPKRTMSTWLTRSSEEVRMIDISQFLKSTDTFDMSSRLGAGLCGSKRQSAEVMYPEESSNTRQDDVGSGTMLNQILGIDQTRKEFGSPTPSPVTPRRIALLTCTPSPNKRFTGIARRLYQATPTPKETSPKKTRKSTGPKTKTTPRSSTTLLPFVPPPDKCGLVVSSVSSPPGVLAPKKRRTSYQKKTPKRKTC